MIAIVLIILGVGFVSYRCGLEEAGHNRPMGVSQWQNHGKKYGYWDYFV